MFCKYKDSGAVKVLKTKTMTLIKDHWTVGFSPYIAGELYWATVELSAGQLSCLLKYHRPSTDYPSELWLDEGGGKYDMYTVFPLNRNPMAKELVYIPTGEILQSTSKCDWHHIICLDEGGNKWLINCNLLTTRENYDRHKRVPNPGPENAAAGTPDVPAVA